MTEPKNSPVTIAYDTKNHREAAQARLRRHQLMAAGYRVRSLNMARGRCVVVMELPTGGKESF